jgi:hypothetical protein
MKMNISGTVTSGETMCDIALAKNTIRTASIQTKRLIWMKRLKTISVL